MNAQTAKSGWGKTYADGIVIWGGYQQQWDDNAHWWMETKKFLQKSRSNISAQSNKDFK
jgi:hypothetical protein